ncbi:MAG: hypothetical protein M1837_000818 [Sclerophora amabilis]|nr:MAG: hypothetical protein M1837_000818 [Sclerophora amabilis]
MRPRKCHGLESRKSYLSATIYRIVAFRGRQASTPRKILNDEAKEMPWARMPQELLICYDLSDRGRFQPQVFRGRIRDYRWPTLHRPNAKGQSSTPLATPTPSSKLAAARSRRKLPNPAGRSPNVVARPQQPLSVSVAQFHMVYFDPSRARYPLRHESLDV